LVPQILFPVFVLLLGLLNTKRFVVDGTKEQENSEPGDAPGDDVKDFQKVYKSILLSPGKVVSISLLNQKGQFRTERGGYAGKALMAKVNQKMTSCVYHL